jgi:hypothetical protein
VTVRKSFVSSRSSNFELINFGALPREEPGDGFKFLMEKQPLTGQTGGGHPGSGPLLVQKVR